MAENIFNQMDVPQLECHFKWFNELNNADNGKWLPLLLNKQLHNDLSSKIEGPEIENSDELPVEAEGYQNTHLSQGLSSLSWRFTLMLRSTLEKSYAEAYQISTELLGSEVANNPSQPQVHIDTFKFIVLGNQLNILKESRSLVECPYPVNDDEIIEIWNGVKSLRNNSEESNEGKAFIYAMKSSLARDLQHTQLRIDFAQKATELNPQCACWHMTLYFALRSLRRSTDFNQHPSQLEIDSCEKAFKLWSSEHPSDISIGIAVQMARLYSELLFTCQRGSQKHREVTRNALHFAREAVRLTPNSKVTKMRLVSLLTHSRIYRRYHNDGHSEAQKLVRECEADVRQCNSEICHKIGKFYNNLYDANFNSANALEWFERSLVAHKTNFPCFSDMLRNEDFRRKPNAEIIEKIDTILENNPKGGFKCQLMFIKGFFLWDSDQEATLNVWLMAVEEAADLNVNLVLLATSNLCYLKDRNRGQALQMMRNVQVFMSQNELAHSDDRCFVELKKIVDSVIEELEVASYRR